MHVYVVSYFYLFDNVGIRKLQAKKISNSVRGSTLTETAHPGQAP